MPYKNCASCGRLVVCSPEAVGVTCERCVTILARDVAEQELAPETQRRAHIIAARKRRRKGVKP